MSNDFDFGFSAVQESDIVDTNKVDHLEKKVAKLSSAVFSLLDNLSKNPEKAYIHWPDRQEKIASFRKAIFDIIHE